MGNIQVKKNGPQQPMTTTSPAMMWDPSRWFTRMMGYDPFREMAPIFGEERFAFEPAFEIKETKDGYLFKADVPGVKLEDIDVSVTDSRLQISGKREAEKEEKGETFYTFERTYGSFSRAFTLPEGIDGTKIHADLRDGVLTVLAPKKPESMPKKIPVATATPAEKKA
jgi:HSP20 family protein